MGYENNILVKKNTNLKNELISLSKEFQQKNEIFQIETQTKNSYQKEILKLKTQIYTLNK